MLIKDGKTKQAITIASDAMSKVNKANELRAVQPQISSLIMDSEVFINRNVKSVDDINSARNQINQVIHNNVCHFFGKAIFGRNIFSYQFLLLLSKIASFSFLDFEINTTNHCSAFKSAGSNA